MSRRHRKEPRLTRRILLLSLSFIFSPGILAFAQDPPSTPDKASASAAGQGQTKPAESDEAQNAALAKAAQNPVANLISFPLQDNTAFGIGPYKRTPKRIKYSARHPISHRKRLDPDHPHHPAGHLAAE